MTSVRNPLLSVTILLLMAGVVKAQPSFDPLEQKRQELKLQAQKLKAELDANFQDAARLERSNPERARELLRNNRLLLQNDALSLPEPERKRILDEVELKLYRINSAAIAQKKADEKALRDAIELRAFMDKLSTDKRKAEMLANASPSATLWAVQKQYRDQQLAMLAMYKRSMQPPPTQPEGFAPGPKKDKNLPPQKDILLMKALDSTMNINFVNQPMKEVLDYIEQKTGGDISIIVDEQGMTEAKMDPILFLNDPVNRKQRAQMKVRTFLRMILAPGGLSYYIEDGQLIVTPVDKANRKVITKSYPVDNLVGGKQLVDAANYELSQSKGQSMGAAGTLLSANIDGLVADITGNIETEHWGAPVGKGPGTIKFLPNTASLQIVASREVQYLLQASGRLDNTKRN